MVATMIGVERIETVTGEIEETYVSFAGAINQMQSFLRGGRQEQDNELIR